MKRLYLFLTNKDIETISFEKMFLAVASDAKFQYIGTRLGYFESELEIFDSLNALLNERRDFNISIVIAHRSWPLEEKLVHEAFGYFPNQVVYLTDVLLKEFSFGDFSSANLLVKEFQSVPSALLFSAGAFLRLGMNGLKAAEYLKIHRNTFNYRLNKFIEVTHLDIRDYHNALLLELYFQLAPRYKKEAR